MIQVRTEFKEFAEKNPQINIHGRFDFAICSEVKYQEPTFTPYEEVKFEYPVEVLPDLLTYMTRAEALDLIGNKFKEDFIAYLNSK